MLAVGTKRGLHKAVAVQIEKPEIERPTDVLIRIKSAGIDGTDHSVVDYDLFDPQPGDDFMILGHEAIGVVEAIGPAVDRVWVGATVVPTVRRGCGQCASCFHGQSDMCATGLFTEHGIHKLRGYFTEYIVDDQEYLVPVPTGLEPYAVLTEPLSISEKALEQIKLIQSRLPWGCGHPDHRYDQPGWGSCKKALIIGAGPLGSLATALLRLEQMDTTVAELAPEDSPRVRLVKDLGAHYVDGRVLGTDGEKRDLGEFDVIIDCSGAASPVMKMMTQLSRNGVFVLTGIPRGESEVCVDGSELIRRLVRFNQVVIGSVNSNRSHFESALTDLALIKEEFGPVLDRVISAHYRLDDYEQAMTKDGGSIKTVFDVS